MKSRRKHFHMSMDFDKEYSKWNHELEYYKNGNELYFAVFTRVTTLWKLPFLTANLQKWHCFFAVFSKVITLSINKISTNQGHFWRPRTVWIEYLWKTCVR